LNASSDLVHLILYNNWRAIIKGVSFVQSVLLLAGLLVFSSVSWAVAVPVTLKQTEQGWQLFRGGQPYFIRGAGGTTAFAALKAAGANSIRTWGDDATPELLDKAHALGLTVTVGIWLGHERHGFDYNDEAQVKKQLNRVREKVLRLKDHPAVLLWGVGNEMEGFEEGDNPAIWKAVNDVAAMIKKLDPHHPTMTVTAFVHGQRIEFLHRRSPAIDIHGINAYGGGNTALLKYLREGNVSKPFVLTEFGPIAPWEAPKTEWGAPYENTSTVKAASYRKSYEQTILAAPEIALGAYAFLWGNKMESTETWFGMFLEDGARLAAVDTMSEIWSGQKPKDQAPTVAALNIEGESVIDPGALINVSTAVVDPEGTTLKSHWALKPESGEILTGGDFRPIPAAIDNVLLASTLTTATLKMPKQPGAYRLFYFVYDEAGNAATANIPLLVKGQPRVGESKPRMPFPVYHERFEDMPWVPSGWMGAVDDLSLDGNNSEYPHEGKASIKIRYEGKFGWAGIAWQHPPNNWGDQEGGFNLTGAQALTLWARGEYGGEKVSFGVGIIEPSKQYPDSAIAKVNDIVLTHEWRRYTVPLRKRNLASIKTGFVVTITGRSSPVTIYLDNIRFNG